MSFFTRLMEIGDRWMPDMTASNFVKNDGGELTMDKTRRIGLTLLLGGLLGLGSYMYASHSSSSDLTGRIQPIVSSQVKGIDWARLCIKQYPEVLWLADENVRITEEGKAILQGSYSEQLFGKKFIEFDRTIMTLHCLKLILDGSDDAYEQFTKAQPESTRLTRESFEALHSQGLSLLKSRFQGMSELEMTQAMEAALVLGDIGKSQQAREIFQAYGVKAPDHDDFHDQVIQLLQKKPDLCPTFNRLTPAAKELLQTTGLAHYGHITHIEGGPDMFSKLRKSSVAITSPIRLMFDYFVHICDIAGALGHVDWTSSLVYTQLCHRAMQGVLESCKVLALPHKTEMDAYNLYLATRADWLGLNIHDQTDRVLTRMGAMLRLFTPEEGTILKQAILKLSPSVQSNIIKELDIGDEEGLERTPTYIPAVLVNLANNPQLGASKEERLSQAVILGLPFIARVLERHKERLSHLEADPTIPLCFNRAAGLAKTNPSALNGEYHIDSEGNVCISEV